MKLKTSYFNEAVLNKNITRFAPLWGIYLVFGVLITLFMGSYSYDPNGARYAADVCEFMPFMAAINFGYAAMCALVLFGDLHKTRMCYSLHAMPMRREGWFLTNAVSGLLFSLVPNLIITVIMLFRCVSFFYIPLIWLLVSTLSFVCFFGIAVFCMHITGKGVAATAMYFLINYLSMIVYGLTELYFARFWPGVIIPMEPFTELSPLSIADLYVETNYDNVTRTLDPEWFSFGNVFLWAGVGIVFAVLALLVYRKRHLESAGEFITLRPAAPVVLVLYAVGLGGVLWLLFNFNFGVLLVGLALGFFTGRMLLQRTVKVFSKKNFLGYGILTGCVLLSIFIAKLDPAGITRWVPEADKIESVQAGSSKYLYSSNSATFEDPEDIELIRQVHSYAVKNSLKDSDASLLDDLFRYDYDTIPVYICYTMKNGSTRERHYNISIGDAEGAELLGLLYSQPELVFDGLVSNAQELQEHTYYIDVMITDLVMDEDDHGILTGSQKDSLIQALEKDWQEGHLAQLWDLNRDSQYICVLNFGLRIAGEGKDVEEHNISVDIFDVCVHTVQWLEENGFSIEGK